jgi:hypothetical protein
MHTLMHLPSREDDSKWPEPNEDGKQEIEIVDGENHISFTCSKIGTLVNVENSRDPEGMRTFYYLVQDLKALVFSMIALHFKVRTFFVTSLVASLDVCLCGSLWGCQSGYLWVSFICPCFFLQIKPIP